MLLSHCNQLDVYLLLIQKSSNLCFELCFVFMFYMSLLSLLQFCGTLKPLLFHSLVFPQPVVLEAVTFPQRNILLYILNKRNSQLPLLSSPLCFESGCAKQYFTTLYLILNFFVQLKSYNAEAQGSIDAFNSLHCCRSALHWSSQKVPLTFCLSLLVSLHSFVSIPTQTSIN